MYLARLNESDWGYEIEPATLAVLRTFEGPFEGGEDGRTGVYARTTGARVGALGWPASYHRAHDFPALARLPGTLVEFVAGCCGRGVDPFDPVTLVARPQLALPWTNAVVARTADADADWIIGTEAGHVLRVRAGTESIEADVDLRRETGHLGSEDIEIRAVWADGHDDFVFAGSSWGNAQSRGPTLPSFFVLVAPRVR